MRRASAISSAVIRANRASFPRPGGIGRASVANVRYLEGSYDRHLFRHLLTNEDVTFGYGGRAPALMKPGLGVTINSKMLCVVRELAEDIVARIAAACRFQC